MWVEHEDGRANPDFILPETTIVVELFGDYWHDEDEVERRITQFKEVGLDATIIWESDVKERPEEVEGTMQALLEMVDAQDVTTESLHCDRWVRTFFVPCPVKLQDISLISYGL